MDVINEQLVALGNEFRFEEVPDECQCVIRKTVRNDGCCHNPVRFCIWLSDDRKLYTCGVKHHKCKMIRTNCSNGVTARILMRASNTTNIFRVVSHAEDGNADPSIPVSIAGSPRVNVDAIRLHIHELNTDIETATSAQDQTQRDLSALQRLLSIQRQQIRTLRGNVHVLKNCKQLYELKLNFRLSWCYPNAFEEGTMCSICHELMQQDGSSGQLVECGHAFHSKCLETWFKDKQSCPICRKQCDPSSYRV